MNCSEHTSGPQIKLCKSKTLRPHVDTRSTCHVRIQLSRSLRLKNLPGNFVTCMTKSPGSSPAICAVEPSGTRLTYQGLSLNPPIVASKAPIPTMDGGVFISQLLSQPLSSRLLACEELTEHRLDASADKSKKGKDMTMIGRKKRNVRQQKLNRCEN